MRFRHLHIDSRYRTVGTDSDFSTSLNDNIELEEGARCWVVGVTFPTVLYTIEEGVNDMWYVAVALGQLTGGYALKLAFGNYGGVELAAEMQSKLRTIDPTAQVSYVSKTSRISILLSPGRDTKVVSHEEPTSPSWRAIWNTFLPTTPYDINDPRSFNEVIRAEPHQFSSSYISAHSDTALQRRISPLVPDDLRRRRCGRAFGHYRAYPCRETVGVRESSFWAPFGAGLVRRREHELLEP